MAITGRGKSPLRSEWVKKISTLSERSIYGDVDQADKTAFNDWFFDSGDTPPASVWRLTLLRVGGILAAIGLIL